MGKHFFRSLKIENFRGIRESDKLENFARVNLFVGNSGCGKTTILESLFLLSGISDPNLINTVHMLRGLKLENPTGLKDLFFKQEFNDGVHLIAEIQKSAHRRLKIAPLYKNPSASRQPSSPVDKGTRTNGEGDIQKTKIAESNADDSLVGVEYDFSVSKRRNGKSKKYKSTLVMDRPDKGIQISTDGGYKEVLKARIARGERLQVPELVDRMLHERRKDILLESLRVVEPKIRDIRVGATGVVFADIEHGKTFFPVALLGDGLLQMMAIVACVDDARNGILLFDEIGSSLHISSIKHVWELIIEQSRKLDAQIFMTTHSKDVVEGLERLYKQRKDLFSDDESDVACYCLDKDSEDQVIGYRYSPEDLRQVLVSNTDIRH